MVPKVAGSSPVGHPTAAAPTIRPGEHQPRVLPARTDANRSSSCQRRCSRRAATVAGSRAIERRPLAVLGSATWTWWLTTTRGLRGETRPGLQVDVIQRGPATSPLRMPLPSLQQSSIEGGELGRREPHGREPLLYQEPGDGSVGRLDKGAGPHCREGLIQGLLAFLPGSEPALAVLLAPACHEVGHVEVPDTGTATLVDETPASALLLDGEAEQLEQPVRVGVAVGAAGWLDGLAPSVSRRAGGVGARREHTGRRGRRLTIPPTKPAQPARLRGVAAAA